MRGRDSRWIHYRHVVVVDWAPITHRICKFSVYYRDILMSAHEQAAHISIATAQTRSTSSLKGFNVHLTFFDKLHKHRVVTTDSKPKAIFIFLDDYTSLDQTCKWVRQGRKTEQGLQKDKSWKKELNWQQANFVKSYPTSFKQVNVLLLTIATVCRWYCLYFKI